MQFIAKPEIAQSATTRLNAMGLPGEIIAYDFMAWELEWAVDWKFPDGRYKAWLIGEEEPSEDALVEEIWNKLEKKSGRNIPDAIN
jgi:hypothetical protein